MEISTIEIEEAQKGMEWSSTARNLFTRIKVGVDQNLQNLQGGRTTGKESEILEDVIELGSKDYETATIIPRFGNEDLTGVDDLSQVSGPEGSNDGGWFINHNGERFYVKFYDDETRSRVEWVANKIYKTMEIMVPDTTIQKVNGRIALVSKEIKNLQELTPQEMSSEQDVLEGFIADVYLGNRDVTGSAFDNILKSTDGGCWRVDNGGSMIYRARGAKKNFPADSIVEIDSMRQSIFPAGQVFSGVSEEDMKIQAKKLVEKLTDSKIMEILAASGISDINIIDELKKSLIGRRNFIAGRFGLNGGEGSESRDLRLNEIGNPEIILRLENPYEQDLNNVKFKVEDSKREIELKKGEAVLIKVPSVISSKILDSITLHHRKSEKYRVHIGDDGWDNEGAYTSVYVYDGNLNRWVNWGEPKFAENRSAGSPEAEILHDWVSEHGRIKPEFILVVGAGKGKNGIVSFKGLELDVFPESTTTQLEKIFTPGTRFVNLERGELLPKYGGGKHEAMGVYINSVPLNHPNIDNLEFPTTTEGSEFALEKRGVSTGDFRLKITKRIPLERVEVSIGDTEDLHGKIYKRDEAFRRGWAKLSLYVEKRKGQTIQLANGINVPPRGVLKGSPKSKMLLEEGDEIVISSKNDASYLMGIRLQ